MSVTLDARGLKCPLPVIKAEKQLDQMHTGETLLVIADDPVARVDIPLLCKKRGLEVAVARDGDVLSFTINT